MRNLLLFIVVMGTLSFTLTKEVSKKTEKAIIAPGKISPIFSLNDINGSLVDLSDFKGKYVYIDIWATWCEPCKEELPYLNIVKNAYKENVEYVSISVNYQKNVDKWKEFVAKENLKDTQLIANKNWHSDFLRAYDVKTIPRFILIDPQGKIVDAYAPRPSEKQLKSLFEKVGVK